MAKFAYNNSYHSAIQMTPFETLSDRRCKSLILWDEASESHVLGPNMLEYDVESIQQIRKDC